MKWKQKSFLLTIVTAYLTFWAMMAIHPHDRFGWFLENLLVFLFFALLVGTYRYFQFTRLSYLLIAIFFTLHTYGAHYSYLTPLDDLLRDLFQFQRANYDRIVHFAFGLLIVLPVRELLEKVVQVRRGWSDLLSVIVILAAGAFYELIEMWISFIVAPEQGAKFVGLQGDLWDPMHDMELAMYGAILTLIIARAVHWQRKKARVPS